MIVTRFTCEISSPSLFFFFLFFKTIQFSSYANASLHITRAECQTGTQKLRRTLPHYEESRPSQKVERSYITLYVQRSWIFQCEKKFKIYNCHANSQLFQFTENVNVEFLWSKTNALKRDVTTRTFEAGKHL
jgi:hypothetical protein